MMSYELNRSRTCRLKHANQEHDRLISAHATSRQAMTTPRTTIIQFRNSIVGPLEKKKEVSADRPTNRFAASETAIQRNLRAIERKKLRHRNCNGETCLSQSHFVQACRENAIAQLALNYIADGLTIFLEAGSTGFALARA